jgi:predicted  nucleic acid-binding Zn-ribbon protein
MSRTTALLRLQNIDLELDSLQARLREVEAALSDSPAVRLAQKQTAEAQFQLEAARISARELELEEQTAEARRAEVEERLYGGRVAHPKELQDLQNDLEMLKRRCAAVEEKQLQALINAEGAEARLVAAQNDLQTAEQATARQNNILSVEREQLRGRASALASEHEGAAPAVRAEDYETYSHLRRTKNGRAVSQLLDGVCAACGVAPSASLVQDARQGIDLILCGNCGRVLHAG